MIVVVLCRSGSVGFSSFVTSRHGALSAYSNIDRTAALVLLGRVCLSNFLEDGYLGKRRYDRRTT